MRIDPSFGPVQKQRPERSWIIAPAKSTECIFTQSLQNLPQMRYSSSIKGVRVCVLEANTAFKTTGSTIRIGIRSIVPSSHLSDTRQLLSVFMVLQ